MKPNRHVSAAGLVLLMIGLSACAGAVPPLSTLSTPTISELPTVIPTWTSTPPPTLTPVPSPTVDACAVAARTAHDLLGTAMGKFTFGDQKLDASRIRCIRDSNAQVRVMLEPLAPLPDTLVKDTLVKSKPGDVLVTGLAYFPSDKLVQHGAAPSIESSTEGNAYIIGVVVNDRLQIGTQVLTFINRAGLQGGSFSSESLKVTPVDTPGCPCLAAAGNFPSLTFQVDLYKTRLTATVAGTDQVKLVSGMYDQLFARMVAVPGTPSPFTTLNQTLVRQGVIPSTLTVEKLVDNSRTSGLLLGSKYKMVASALASDYKPVPKGGSAKMLGGLLLVTDSNISGFDHGKFFFGEATGKPAAYAIVVTIADLDKNGVVSAGDDAYVQFVPADSAFKPVPSEPVRYTYKVPVVPTADERAVIFGSFCILDWDGIRFCWDTQ